MDQLATMFRLKDGVSEPKLYLGTDVKKTVYQRDDGSVGQCWTLGSHSYVQEALNVADNQMKLHNLQPSSTRRYGKQTPFNTDTYRPELDSTEFCNETIITVYQNLVDVLQWMCKLGQIDILHEVSIMSQYLAQPQHGHLTQILNIFYYLKHHSRSWMPMDPYDYDIDWVPQGDEPFPQVRAEGMKEIYTEAEDVLPHNIPRPRGEPVTINVFVDADHAGNKITRRSHTGILIYCNMAPIVWFSKRQNTVESSTFGSEFIAMKIATELIEALTYKLRMFGVPLTGPARIFCDNESVVKSSSFPESTLRKKHCSIAYHKVREAIAAGKQLVYYEHTSSNLADLFTKVLSHSKRSNLVQAILV